MYATHVRGLHVDQMWIQNGGWNICNSCSWAACRSNVDTKWRLECMQLMFVGCMLIMGKKVIAL